MRLPAHHLTYGIGTPWDLLCTVFLCPLLLSEVLEYKWKPSQHPALGAGRPSRGECRCSSIRSEASHPGGSCERRRCLRHAVLSFGMPLTHVLSHVSPFPAGSVGIPLPGVEVRIVSENPQKEGCPYILHVEGNEKGTKVSHSALSWQHMGLAWS